MKKCQEKFLFTAENIDNASEFFQRVCNDLKMDHQETIKQRLAFENVLMCWAENFGENDEFEFIVYRRFFTPYIAVRCLNSKSVNPFVTQIEDSYSNSILNLLQNTPEYYYNNGINTALFKLKKHSMNAMLRLGIIIVIALLFSFLGEMFLSPDVLNILLTNIVQPVYDKFLDVLFCIAGPLIFCSVAWGIYGIGDTATFNKLGKRLLLLCLEGALVAGVFAFLSIPFFTLHFDKHAADFSQIFQIFQLLLDMFPKTIVAPFADGNTLQIIVIAIVVGIAMLYLGKRSKIVAEVIDQLNSIVNFILSIIGKMVPVFVALVLINLIWSNGLNVISTAWKFIIIEFVITVSWCILVLIMTSYRLKVHPIKIAKNCLSPSLVAFTTASSAASFGDIVSSCQKMGVQNSLIGFGVPLAIVSQKSIYSAGFTLTVLYVAEMYDVKISIGWLIMAAVVIAITAIATPPIPGGGSIAYTMIFTQMGLPLESLGVILALDIVTDFLLTGTNVFCHPMLLLNIAKDFGILDRDKLNS